MTVRPSDLSEARNEITPQMISAAVVAVNKLREIFGSRDVPPGVLGIEVWASMRATHRSDAREWSKSIQEILGPENISGKVEESENECSEGMIDAGTQAIMWALDQEGCSVSFDASRVLRFVWSVMRATHKAETGEAGHICSPGSNEGVVH